MAVIEAVGVVAEGAEEEAVMEEEGVEAVEVVAAAVVAKVHLTITKPPGVVVGAAVVEVVGIREHPCKSSIRVGVDTNSSNFNLVAIFSNLAPTLGVQAVTTQIVVKVVVEAEVVMEEAVVVVEEEEVGVEEGVVIDHLDFGYRFCLWYCFRQSGLQSLVKKIMASLFKNHTL